ncbi:MAG: serine/threonine protein kinase [Myxococcales bacterium]|nr:serine/threonine protein kinase [Myxococcales bacterium]
MAYDLGSVIQDRYRILAKVGSGAHGVVYRARDLETRDEVALKFLGSGFGFDPQYNRRLEREAQAMARLRGTHAVHVHNIRHTDDGLTYIVMEMLHGHNLEDYLAQAEQLGGQIKPDRLLMLLRPVVDTLEAAHAQGIVHRDLKPANIFVIDKQHGGGVRLLDFGLVKVLNASALTDDGMVAGSPSYIAPEAWAGNPRILDHRIDLYALGVIVFRALSGHLPTPRGGLINTMQWATGGERPSLHALRTSLPPSIDFWVEKALAIAPEDRFQTVRSQLNALESILATPVTSPF